MMTLKLIDLFLFQRESMGEKPWRGIMEVERGTYQVQSNKNGRYIPEFSSY